MEFKNKRKHSIPIPCLGLGFSAGGFWNGKLIGTSITSYLTLKGSSGESVWRREIRKTKQNKTKQSKTSAKDELFKTLKLNKNT